MVLTRGLRLREAGRAGQGCPPIDSLPGEVLLQILSNVDDFADMRAFLRTNKSMRALRADPVLKIEWMLKHPSQKALCAAAEMGRGDAMLQMLQSGVPAVAACTTQGAYNPVVLATEHNLPQVVEWLWHRSEVRTGWQVGAAAHTLRVASFRGHVQCLQVLLSPPSQLQADSTPPDTRTRFYHTPLQAAASVGQLEAVQFLLTAGASVLPDPNGLAAFHYACWASHQEDEQHDASRVIMVRALLEAPNGMSMLDYPANGRYDSGLTPIHFAARSGLVECCKELIQAWASVNVLSEEGKSPFQLAGGYFDTNKSQVQKVLKKAGAHPG